MGPRLGIPGFAPLRPFENRLLCIAVLLVGWALYALYLRRRTRVKNDKMLDALTDDTGADEVKSAEASALKRKMQDAVGLLKGKKFSSTGGRRYVYELPWYLIIGPPGAGKTTLLTNSGLNFPLEESHGKYSVKGLGGTRNCDWWFTDQAVLLDTAGRYTTQDSDAEVDKSAWDTFLQLLKDNRKRRPVNGMIVALALHDLIDKDNDQLVQVAKTIRFRITEIHEKFGMRPPVYLLITKCDLLAGFAEYFSDYNEEQRKQTWGFTLSTNEKVAFTERTTEELEQLRDILHKQVITKLENENSQQHRDRIYGFPKQFTGIQKKLETFIERFASESNLQDDIYLRGMYFTSATQDGSALDQLVSSVSKSFGFTTGNSEKTVDTGKSFFIHDLLTDVIFGESGLAGTNLSFEKRARILKRSAYGAVAMTTICIFAVWGFSHNKNTDLMASVKSTSENLETSLEHLPTDSLDLIQTSQMLALARNLDTTRTDTGFFLKHTGLYQGKTISPIANRKYDDLLIDTLLSRLMVRLEHQMRAESDNSEFLFEALKTYQMLDNAEEYSSKDVIGWFRFDYEQNLPGTISQESRQELLQHTEHLFRDNKPPIRLPRPLNSDLINEYQSLAASVPIEKRAYHRLKQQHADSMNTPVKLTDKTGDGLAIALTLSTDQSFNTAIPQLFTVNKYQTRFLPSISNVAETLANDLWVLGPYAESVTVDDVDKLKKSVTNQYYDEYINYWQSFLENLRLKKTSDLKELTNFLSLVTDTDSPLKKLLVAVVDETTLTVQTSTENTENTDETNARQQDLTNLLGKDSVDTAAIELDSDPVTEHFASLHSLLDNWETNGSTMDSVLQQMKELNLPLLSMATTPGASGDTNLTNELGVKIEQMSAKSTQLPEALATLVTDVTNEVRDLSSGGFCAQLNNLWTSEVYPFYAKALANHYPLSRRATRDISLEDFGKFFGPGGILDTYVHNNLKSIVQKTSGQWTWVGSGTSQCLSDRTLRQLALADDIQKTFFSANSATPSFSFNLNPGKLTIDKSLSELHLTVGNRDMESFHGPVKGNTNFLWPGESGSTEASIRVEPVVAGAQSRISHNGPWAILRLLDNGKLSQIDNGNVGVEFNFGGRVVQMEFRSSSFNPLASESLKQFSAPQSL